MAWPGIWLQSLAFSCAIYITGLRQGPAGGHALGVARSAVILVVMCGVARNLASESGFFVCYLHY